jgi:hypothetical protein
MQVTIRCHPCAPIATDEVEHWLWSELDRLRSQAPNAILRMLRLTQPTPTGRLDVGWLVEVEVADGDALAEEHGLDDVLRDMRLLGLQPTVFRTNGHATHALADAAERTWDVPSQTRDYGSTRPRRIA